MDEQRASHEQITGIVIVAGRLLLRHRDVDLFTLTRTEANRIRMELEAEYRTGTVYLGRERTAPPPDTRQRKRRRAGDDE